MLGDSPEIRRLKTLLAAEESEKLLGEIYKEFARQSEDPIWKELWQRFAVDEDVHARQIQVTADSFPQVLNVDPQHVMMVLESLRHVVEHVKTHQFTDMEKLRVALKHEEKLLDFRIIEAAAKMPAVSMAGRVVPPSEHIWILRRKLQDEQVKAMQRLRKPQ